MRDCDDVAMRDLLPDLLHDWLPASVRAEVQRHVDGCDACRAELGILRRVASLAVGPAVDARRIASAIQPYRRVSGTRRLMASAPWRVAAAILVVVGGALMAAKARDRQTPAGSRSRVVVAPVLPATPAALDSPPQETVSAPAAARTPVAPRATTELAIGEPYHDLTTAELRELLDEVGRLDGITSSETDVVVPAPNRGGT